MESLAATPVAQKCTACPLHASALTNCMTGRGPARAEVMIVAQGPGGKEDMQGTPLIGPTGQLLHKLLTQSGYDPRSIFYTNATRCRPPNVNGKDRLPTPKEIEACRTHLKAEIRRVRPQAIIALGDAALRALCKQSGISNKRGKTLPLHAYFEYECEVWPTYHPALCFKMPIRERIIATDLRRIRDRHVPKEDILWTWFGEEPLWMTEDRTVAVDIETLLLGNPETKKDVYTEYPVQIACATRKNVAVARQADLPDLLRPVSNRAAMIVTHNGWEFDIPRIRTYIDPNFPLGRDTLVLAYLDDETQPLGLEALCVRYLGIPGWKEDADAALGSDAFAAYNARDAWYTLRLYDALVERLGQRIALADEIIAPGYVALEACSARGVYIDQGEVRRAEDHVSERVQAARSELRRLTNNADFNPNANRQVAAIFEALGAKLSSTPSGEKQVDKETLNKLALQPRTAEFAKAMLAYREPNKTLSTYIKPYKRVAVENGGDGRIHPTYHVFKKWDEPGGTETGRTSCAKPNDQNLDRKYKAFRSAPPGFVRVEADYSAVEFRGAAWCAREETILQRYRENPNWDPHLFFAFRLYIPQAAEIPPEEQAWAADHAKEWIKAHPAWKERRQIAKSANFSQLYIGTAETLIHYASKMGITLTPAQAGFMHRTFHTVYNFRPWYQSVWDFVAEHGYIETATGRRRHFGNVRALSYSGRVDVTRQAVNMLVQPTFTADVSLLGLRACHEAGLPITNFVHDSIGFEFAEQLWNDEGERAKIAEQIRWAMVEYPVQVLREKFGVNLDVPLELEITTA